ncbi:MAG: hypothetical protein Tsb0020_35230 [Haliangiales bacterium]
MSSQQAALQRALTIRLNLQISLAAVPMIEEWMDLPLTRWLESVPSPPEMPSGHEAQFAVTLASDLSRLTWGAYGNPAGFIPKMARYLESCRIGPEDVALIDALGNGLEPSLVGSWVRAQAGAVHTGWQFCDAHRFDAIQEQFGDHDAKAKLVAWLERAGIERFERFEQTIGDAANSRIEFAIPGADIDAQLAALSGGFEALAGAPLADAVATSFRHAANPALRIGVDISGGDIAKVSAICPGLGNDVISELCDALGLTLAESHAPLQGSFGVAAPEAAVYTRQLADASAATAGEDPAAATAGEEPKDLIDLIIVPTGSGGMPPNQRN